MTEYDPTVIQKHAEQLYAKANSVIWEYGISGFILGCLGFFFGVGVGSVLLIAFTYIGIHIGVNKSFQIKLQAQTVLCQVQIEENTRGLQETEKNFPAILNK